MKRKIKGVIKELMIPFGSKNPVITVEVLNGDPEIIEKDKDKELDFEYSKHREPRSLDANRMLWACLGDMAQELRCDKEELYIIMLKRYGVFDTSLVHRQAIPMLEDHFRLVDDLGETTIINEDGNAQKMVYVQVYPGSSKYNSKQFSVLLDGVVSEMKEMGLSLPPSEDMKRALEEWEAVHDKAK